MERTPSSSPTTKNSPPQRSEKASGQKRKLAELLKLITTTARAKGWEAEVTTRDSRTHRFATVSVSRHAGLYQITGLFDVTCHERVRITYNQTSFHSTGLEDLYEAIGNEFWKLPWVKPSAKGNENGGDHPELSTLERLLRRFHRTVRQLKHRHDNRTSFSVLDEYDVQDLLHALLRGLFDDVRPEEYTPSYAGGTSRMDFLLKTEQIVIETKFASESLKDKQLGEQLIVDIGRYQSHPDCRKLICFIYDPHGNVKNPAGLEADLSRAHGKLEVNVIVVST
jgi:hypothetical protein